MSILADKQNNLLFQTVLFSLLGSLVAVSAFLVMQPEGYPWFILAVGLAAAAAVINAVLTYLRRRDKTLDAASETVAELIKGGGEQRIPCETDGSLARLFHEVNSLAAILSAQAETETETKIFLKNTISDISHQLKTPVAALNVYNGILQDETLSREEAARFVSLSEQELERIESLVQNLLRITKLDAGTVVFDQKPENLSAMLSGVQRRFAFRAETEGKTLRLEGPEDLELVCDRSWFLEAVNNLVKNALDHTASGDEITLRWKKDSLSVLLSVEDTGSGISEEDIFFIFKRFYRSRHSQDTEGIGLGLPLVKSITEAHGGSVEVASEPGRGSVFTLRFPTKM